MQQSDLRPAGTYANSNGVKIIGFGGPGSGKTPVANTMPRGVLLSVEPGLLSMQGSQLPTYKARNTKQVDEFFAWLKGSRERYNYWTVGVDSASELADMYIRENPKKISHGLQLYGAMAEWVFEKLSFLYLAEQMNTYVICKQMVEKSDSSQKLTTYFPGNELNKTVPYLFDEVLHLDIHTVPGQGQLRAFHCHSGFGVVCRDRSGKLAEFEPPDLSYIINKCQ